jgi:hypothetical protein
MLAAQSRLAPRAHARARAAGSLQIVLPEDRPADSAPTPAQRFFEPLLRRRPGGQDWLPALLRAAPLGSARLGALAERPGYLDPALTVPGLDGRRPCFHRPVAPPAALLHWFLEHPERLRWPASAEQLSPQSQLLRRALLLDEPPGARARAQSRARELAPVRSAFAREWWRFEETFAPDCLLLTESLALTFVTAGEALAPVSDWYPERNVLHRALEAAASVAEDRLPGTIVLSPAPLPEASEEGLRGSLPAGAPHLDDAARARLASAYLGNLTWERAAAAVS